MSEKRNALRVIKRRYRFSGLKLAKRAKRYLHEKGFGNNVGKFIDYLRTIE